MEQGSPSRETAILARRVDLLDLVSEFVDAHTDTVQLIVGDQRTELRWLAHCDYLRALQRLGRETLARHDQHQPPTPSTVAHVASITSAVGQGWTAALGVLHSRVRAVQALPPYPIAHLLAHAPLFR